MILVTGERRVRDWRELERQIVIGRQPPRRFAALPIAEQAHVVAFLAGQAFRKAEEDRRAERLLETPRGRRVVADLALEALER